MVGLPGIRGIRHKSLRLFRKTECLPDEQRKDGYNNDEHVFEYRTEQLKAISGKSPLQLTMAQHQVSSKRIHTISYIDAN